MTYDELMTVLTKRRSVRYFSELPVEPEICMKILTAGRLAPSVENIQPWHFHIVRSPKLKEKLMGTSCYGNFVSGASAFIVVSCDRKGMNAAKEPIWNPHELEYSCVAAMHSMMLAATTMNIGTCWVSLHHGPAHDILKLPDHQIVVGGLMLGHMKKDEEEASKEHTRLPLETMCTYYE